MFGVNACIISLQNHDTTICKQFCTATAVHNHYEDEKTQTIVCSLDCRRAFVGSPYEKPGGRAGLRYKTISRRYMLKTVCVQNSRSWASSTFFHIDCFSLYNTLLVTVRTYVYTLIIGSLAQIQDIAYYGCSRSVGGPKRIL